MIQKTEFLKSTKIVLTCLVALALIGFVEKKHSAKVLEDVEIKIKQQKGNFFLAEDDLLEVINYHQAVGGKVTAEVMTDMEQLLLSHDYVELAEVYRDLRGKLIVEVTQSEPIARIVRPDNPDAYITADNKLLPVSDKFSARVLLVTGDYADKLIGADEKHANQRRQLVELTNYIYQRPFWSAQIAQLDIDKQGDIIMYPQVGKQIIEFGTADNIESKFVRLDTFYKKILPKKGWNDYQRVSVKYTDQIVCE